MVIMENLIKAFQIFLKYDNSKYPLYCENGKLFISRVHADMVIPEDKKVLSEMGFHIDEYYNCFYLYIS